MKAPSRNREADAVRVAPVRQARREAAFLDNRSIAAVQRQLDETANLASRTLQHKTLANLADNSPRLMQQRALSERINDGSSMAVQRVEEEEPVQEPVQGKFDAGLSVQLKEEPTAKPNNTGLPDQLKSGVETLSGMSMDHVQVHYNSPQPVQLNALAYAQGSDIHVGPGQEKHLPHEAWHVVQQAQGRVKPTMQMKEGVPVNDDAGLEHEADVMGAKAMQK